jgi:hypothetical protein
MDPDEHLLHYLYLKVCVLKGDHPIAIFNNFNEMERSSDILFHKLDEMVEEYMKNSKK